MVAPYRGASGIWLGDQCRLWDAIPLQRLENIWARASITARVLRRYVSFWRQVAEL